MSRQADRYALSKKKNEGSKALRARLHLVFKSFNPKHALAVCLRLQRMKRRHRRPGFKMPPRHIPGKDRTYRSIIGHARIRPGEGVGNVLLINKGKNWHWQNTFGDRTLDEIIRLLSDRISVKNIRPKESSKVGLEVAR
jgi:hypothetical protein